MGLNAAESIIADLGKPHLDFYEQRVDLAAAFRTFARLNMHEGVANHFSLVVECDADQKPTKVLINPANRAFQNIKASDLLVMDVSSKDAIMREVANFEYKKDDRRATIDPTAICIHGFLHLQHPSANCIIHLHPQYSTALSC